MRKLILGMIGAAALLMGAPPVPANAQPVDPERVALAKTYLEISGQVITAKQLGDIAAAKLIELNPDLKDQITTATAGLIPRYDSDVQTMIDEVATAYPARFTGPGCNRSSISTNRRLVKSSRARRRPSSRSLIKSAPSGAPVSVTTCAKDLPSRLPRRASP